MSLEDAFDGIHCPACRIALEYRIEGSTQGWHCTQCEWCVVTTWMPEFMQDRTCYEVTVVSGNFRDVGHLKAVAYLLGGNWIMARERLRAGEPFGVASGDAHDVIPVRDRLMAAGLEFRIAPPFPW